MSSTKLKANHEWLIWARKTAHYNVKEIAEKMKVNKETVKEWESTGKIEYNTLVELAEYYQRPPMIFFNVNKPEYEKPIPDFRTINSNEKDNVSPEISFEIRSANVRRENLIKLEVESDEYKIPEFSLNNIKTKDPTEISDIIRDKVGMKRSNKDLDYWISKVEDLGVLVFQFYGIEPQDIRGYALYYDKLPIIGINHKEYKNGKKFTLFHELAHLAIKKQGLSNFDRYYLRNETEILCNQIAAESLVPSKMIINQINDMVYSTLLDDKTLKRLSRFFKVSNEVIIRRLLTLNFISKKDYQSKKDELDTYIGKKKEVSQKNKQKPHKDTEKIVLSDPQSKYRKKAAIALNKNGMYYTNSIFKAYDEDLITIDDVAENLGVSLEVIREIRKKIMGDSFD